MKYIQVEGQKYPVLSEQIRKFQGSYVYFFEIPNGDVSLVVNGSEMTGSISRYGETSSLSFEETKELYNSLNIEHTKNEDDLNFILNAIDGDLGYTIFLKKFDGEFFAKEFSEGQIRSTDAYKRYQKELKNYIEGAIEFLSIDKDKKNLFQELSDQIDFDGYEIFDFNDEESMAVQLLTKYPDKLINPIINHINEKIYGIIADSKGNILEHQRLRKSIENSINNLDTISAMDIITKKVSTDYVLDEILSDYWIFDTYDEYVEEFGEEENEIPFAAEDMRNEIKESVVNKFKRNNKKFIANSYRAALNNRIDPSKDIKLSTPELHSEYRSLCQRVEAIMYPQLENYDDKWDANELYSMMNTDISDFPSLAVDLSEDFKDYVVRVANESVNRISDHLFEPIRALLINTEKELPLRSVLNKLDSESFYHSAFEELLGMLLYEDDFARSYAFTTNSYNIFKDTVKVFIKDYVTNEYNKYSTSSYAGNLAEDIYDYCISDKRFILSDIYAKFKNDKQFTDTLAEDIFKNNSFYFFTEYSDALIGEIIDKSKDQNAGTITYAYSRKLSKAISLDTGAGSPLHVLFENWVLSRGLSKKTIDIIFTILDMDKYYDFVPLTSEEANQYEKYGTEKKEQLSERWIRSHWAEALSKSNNINIPRIIKWGLYDSDLVTLKELHRSNILRKQIETLLEECNFHDEVAYWSKGLYDKLDILGIIRSEMSNTINSYIENNNLFTKETVSEFFGTAVTEQGIQESKRQFYSAFVSYFYDCITDMSVEELQPLTDGQSINNKAFDNFLSVGKNKAIKFAMNSVKGILATNTVDGKPLVKDLDGILTNYLLQSLTKYLEDNNFPQNLIHEEGTLQLYLYFDQSSEIKEYYQKEVEMASSDINFKSWLKVNLPHENLCNLYWIRATTQLKERYYTTLIDKIMSDSTIAFDGSLYNSIIQHPVEAAKVYDNKLSATDFIELFLNSTN